MPDTTDDITENYICGHNGIGWDAKWCITVKDYSNYANFTNPKDGIWYVDFMRSTYVEYLEYYHGYDDWTADYFYIEGSVDGKNWKRLLTRGTGKLEHGNYYLEHHGFFRHYRIRCFHTQIRYFRWFGYDADDNLFILKKVVPRMTSDSLNGYSLTCSGKNDGQIHNLTASDDNWGNLKDRLNSEFWIKYELPKAAVVNMIDLGAANDSESDRFPLWFKIEASNDDVNWTILLERAELSRWYQLETRQYYIDNDVAYKFYKFTFPKSPKVGDRIEIVSISDTKLPINIVGNSEAGKNLALVFPDQTYTGVSDGSTIIASINEKNIIYTFKCVTAQNTHTWLLEDTVLYAKLQALEVRIAALEEAITTPETEE